MTTELTPDLTPVESHGGYLVKRDDLFEVAGAKGAKARTCWHLAQNAKVGLVTAGGKSSPQIQIVARIAKHKGLEARCHTSTVKTPELEEHEDTLVRHKFGRSSNINYQAEHDEHLKQGWTWVPFGMECPEAVEMTRHQVKSLVEHKDHIRRIVIPLGSGMSAAGVLCGLDDFGLDIPVLGVQVGFDPVPNLVKYAPANWRERLKIVKSPNDYDDRIDESIGEIKLDPIYEAKCVEYLEPGDLLWVIGIRANVDEPKRPPRKPRPLANVVPVAAAPLPAATPAAPDERATRIKEYHANLIGAEFTAIHFAKQVGEELIAAKEELGHGPYTAWFKAQGFGFCAEWGRLYVRIAEEWEGKLKDAVASGNLSVERARQILCRRSTNEELATLPDANKAKRDLALQFNKYVSDLDEESVLLLERHWNKFRERLDVAIDDFKSGDLPQSDREAA